MRFLAKCTCVIGSENQILRKCRGLASSTQVLEDLGFGWNVPIKSREFAIPCLLDTRETKLVGLFKLEENHSPQLSVQL